MQRSRAQRDLVRGGNGQPQREAVQNDTAMRTKGPERGWRDSLRNPAEKGLEKKPRTGSLVPAVDRR